MAENILKHKSEIGNRYGRLIVTEYSHSKNAIFWKCLCDCGKYTIARTALLKDGSKKSCGCASKEAAVENCRKYIAGKKLGYKHPRKLKDLYRNMIDRCYNPKNKRYYTYGGRGISVCDEWRQNRRGFYKWAVDNGYDPSLQINRINNDGNYEPSNCNFVTRLVNINNTSHNKFIEWNGQRKSISDWARDIGARPQALIHRFNRGWTVERALTQPFRGRL